MSIFKHVLKNVRTYNNLTLDELSELLEIKGIKISKHGLSAYELGKSEPNIDTLIALSKVFNVTIDYLVGNTDDKEFIPVVTLTNEKQQILEFVKHELIDYIRKM